MDKPAKPAFRTFALSPTKLKAVEGEERTFEGMASTADLDREGEVIEAGAWSDEVLERYMQNPIITHMHDWSDPIGRAVDVKRKRNGLWIKAQLGRKQRALEVWQDIEDGILSTLSVGFDPVQASIVNDGKTLRHKEVSDLYEVGVVPLPANPKARLIVAKGIGLELPRYDAAHAIPFEALTLAPEEMAWQWGAEAKKAYFDATEACSTAYAWDDGLDPRLPHHKVVGEDIVTVWRGVAASMGVLLGARGGADIPEHDKAGVYEHLAKHYEEFEKDAPEVGDDPADWPAFSEVDWKHDERELVAEAGLYDGLARAMSIKRSADEILRHWEKVGRALSPDQLAALRETKAAYGDLPVDDPQEALEDLLRGALGDVEDVEAAVARVCREHAALG